MDVSGRGTIYKAQVKNLPSTTMGIASLRESRKDKKTGEWISTFYDLVAWGDMGSWLGGLPDKTKVNFSGYLIKRQYEARDGTKKEQLQVVVTGAEVIALSEGQQYPATQPSDPLGWPGHDDIKF